MKVYFPQSAAVESYVRSNGINAFYQSIELRKACCFARKVEPLQRALAGKKAWITGLRAQQAATRVGLPTREYDEGNKLEKFNPLADWSEKEVWTYIKQNKVPYKRTARQVLPEHRLRALHPCHQPRRRCPLRSLVVGISRTQGMRPARQGLKLRAIASGGRNSAALRLR